MGSESVSLGMDDIDSPNGGCTTHFASLLVERLEARIEEWTDYPHLIRLNPNIPYRTRGNGGVCLNFTIDSNDIGEIIPLVSGMVQEYADLKYPNTNPGVAIVTGEIPSTLKSFSQKAVWRTVPKSLAFRIADEHQIGYFTHGNGRGLVGALAAIGHGLEGDHTYEYLSYRKMSETHEDRGVNKASVELMNAKMGDRTFSNLDLANDTILIEPHGPDPVLFGIRGEAPPDVIEAASYIKSSQKIDRWMVFRTNQGTGEHLTHNLSIDSLRPYMSVSLSAEVVKAPHLISGGHVIFSVSDSSHRMQCAAYEPTGDFRWDVLKLRAGDKITIHAGVRPRSHSYDMTLNVEGMVINHLENHVEYSNPVCEQCNRRMKSAGKGKGFKCPHCGHRAREHKKVERHVARELQLGYYLPRSSAQRHLTRPHSRVGKQNLFTSEPIEMWHNP